MGALSRIPYVNHVITTCFVTFSTTLSCNEHPVVPGVLVKGWSRRNQDNWATTGSQDEVDDVEWCLKWEAILLGENIVVSWPLNWTLSKKIRKCCWLWSKMWRNSCFSAPKGNSSNVSCDFFFFDPSWSPQVKQLQPTMLLRLIMLIVALSCFTKQPRQLFRPRNTAFLQGVNLPFYCSIFFFAGKVFWFAKQRSHRMLLKGTVLESARFEKLLPKASQTAAACRGFPCLSGDEWSTDEKKLKRTWVAIVSGNLAKMTKAEWVLFLISPFSA